LNFLPTKVLAPIAATLLGFAVAAAASDQKTLVLRNPGIHDLSGHVDCFIDQDGGLTFSEISGDRYRRYFSPRLSRFVHLGFNSGRIWYRFSAVNKTGQELYLQVNHRGADQFRLYVRSGDRNFTEKTMDGLQPLTGLQPLMSSSRYLALNAGPGDTLSCYLSYRPESLGMTPLKIGNLDVFLRQEQRGILAQGFYFGFIVFIFIYHLFIYLTIRRITYLYLALFTASIGLLYAFYNGYIHAYSPNVAQWPSGLLPVLGALSAIWFILFTFSFLRSRSTSPVNHLWLMAILGIYGINIVLSLFGLIQVSLQINLFNLLFSLGFATFTGIVAYRRGFQPAGYYLVALAVCTLALAVSLFREFGLLSPSWISNNAGQLGAALTILFLAFAQGRKINNYITMRKEAQTQALNEYLEKERLIRFQNSLLETKVHERTRDLEQSIRTLKQQGEELQEANEFKDKVLALLSHDLRSPLSSLSGMLTLLQQKALSLPEQEVLLTGIRRSLRNAGSLLDEVLDWAESSKPVDRHYVDVDLHAVIEEVFSLFRAQAQDKNIDLVNETEKDRVFYGDENLIRLVVRNLVSNAIKFTPKNGQVIVGQREHGKELILYVQDTGIGIASADIRKIMKDKMRFSTRGTENEKGTGLGLHLCREFLEKCGGSLEVVSQPSEGSTFTVHFGSSARPMLHRAATLS
jgi:two-component system, sensor histidine kinase LadS